MVAVPVATPFTTPAEETVAILGLLLTQIISLLSIPFGLISATNVIAFPLIMFTDVRFNSILDIPCFTVILQDAFFWLPSFAFAVITAVPVPTVVTTPVEETVATFLLLLVQLTVLLLAFLGRTVAFRVILFPVVSTTELLFSCTLVTGCFTVTLQASFFFPYFAVIVAVPFLTALTLPFLETVATFLLLLVQVIFSFVPVTFNV